MPAYRSAAEADIRNPVVERLRELLPGCRIIHEIQCAVWGPNRIDVMAVTETRIAAAEIKSERDKLDRLKAQVAAMKGCAHHAIAALHAKHIDTKHGLAIPPWEAVNGATVWGFFLPDGLDQRGAVFDHSLSHERRARPSACLPPGAIDMLWREELRQIVARRGLHRACSKLTIPELQDVLIWNLTGAEITREVCAALRRRDCAEADPPVGKQP